LQAIEAQKNILLQGYFSCNKINAAIKFKIYFIAAFILVYCTHNTTASDKTQ